MGKMKKRTKLMDKVTHYDILPEDYRNRDGIIIRKEDLKVDLNRDEARNTTYYLFAHAHGKATPAIFLQELTIN